jgi:hypothetical protein
VALGLLWKALGSRADLKVRKGILCPQQMRSELDWRALLIFETLQAFASASLETATHADRAYDPAYNPGAQPFPVVHQLVASPEGGVPSWRHRNSAFAITPQNEIELLGISRIGMREVHLGRLFRPRGIF